MPIQRQRKPKPPPPTSPHATSANASRWLRNDRKSLDLKGLRARIAGLRLLLGQEVAAREETLDDTDDEKKLDRLAAAGDVALENAGKWLAQRVPSVAKPRPGGRMNGGHLKHHPLWQAEVWFEDAISALAAIQRAFPMGGGGFGALGRAHDIEAVDGLTDATHPAKGTFLDGIELDGKQLSADEQVAKETATAPGEKSGPLTVLGVKYDGGPVPGGLLAQTEAAPMKALDASAWDVTYTGAPVARSRGKGQLANMNRTNAAGYAWVSGVPTWNSQRWEWLHVRAASLGGQTDGRNLVVGTRDANTHMIPFESNVRVLANLVGGSKQYDALDVKWAVSGPDAKAHHKVAGISLAWSLRASAKGKTDKVPEPEGKAEFAPLDTSANISKKEVDVIEGALKAVRDTVPEP